MLSGGFEARSGRPKNAAKFILGFRVASEKRVGAVDQHIAELKGSNGKTEHPITARQHLRPHVVERI
jgi:hypothetical protein